MRNVIHFIFGGAFDPIHLGHLDLALYLYAQYNYPISLMPLNGQPNYKAPLQANISHRINMLKLLIKEYPKELNLELLEANSPCYTPTYQSLTKLKLKYPHHKFYFIIGSDSLLSLDSWDNYFEILNLANLIVFPRGGYAINNLKPEIYNLIKNKLTTIPIFKRKNQEVVILNYIPKTCSSTLIRQKLYNQEDVSNLLPLSIINYIKHNHLYQG